MRAIETRYKGRLFRSRLEARYAVLFDALHIEWDYEPEGFEFDDGMRYLPDFWLKDRKQPLQGGWVEVKGQTPMPQEVLRMRLLANASRHFGAILCGSPERVEVYLFEPDSAHEVLLTRDKSDPLGVFLCRLNAYNDFREYNDALVRALSARFEFGGRA